MLRTLLPLFCISQARSALLALALLLSTLLALTACATPTPRPTLAAPLEIITPTSPATRAPTRTPRPILSPTIAASPTLTQTVLPTRDPSIPTPTFDVTPIDAPVSPRILTQVALDPAPTLAPDETVIGHSAEGRAIVARTLGTGPYMLLLVAGIHGGFEVNTVELANGLAAHFAANPEDIAPPVMLAIIPAMNPDGVAGGRAIEARFNANGVDLNRNWGCDWAAVGFWRSYEVPGGETPFSEPETGAVADYILGNAPLAVVFYHSAANGVFAGRCAGDHGSAVLGHVYGAAANYPSDARFDAYPITGDASNWVDGLGIPAITVELQSYTDDEFDRNYAGVLAVQCAITGREVDAAARAWVEDYCDTGGG